MECTCNVCKALRRNGFPVTGTGPRDREDRQQKAWILVQREAGNHLNLNDPNVYNEFHMAVKRNYAEILKLFM